MQSAITTSIASVLAVPPAAVGFLGVTSSSSPGLSRALQAGLRVQVGVSPSVAAASTVVAQAVSGGGSAAVSTAITILLASNLPSTLASHPGAANLASALGYSSVASMTSAVGLDASIPVSAVVMSASPSPSPLPLPPPPYVLPFAAVIGIAVAAVICTMNVLPFWLTPLRCCPRKRAGKLVSGLPNAPAPRLSPAVLKLLRQREGDLHTKFGSGMPICERVCAWINPIILIASICGFGVLVVSFSIIALFGCCGGYDSACCLQWRRVCGRKARDVLRVEALAAARGQQSDEGDKVWNLEWEHLNAACGDDDDFLTIVHSNLASTASAYHRPEWKHVARAVLAVEHVCEAVTRVGIFPPSPEPCLNAKHVAYDPAYA
jgi:hypothetical protein